MGFDFTVALVPSDTNIDQELQYVKSALLYADKVTLISPVAYLYTRLANDSSQLDMRDMIRLLDYVVPMCQTTHPELYQEMMGYLNSHSKTPLRSSVTSQEVQSFKTPMPKEAKLVALAL